jgi:ABC-type branched-subunit amino acid transport system ATPase component
MTEMAMLRADNVSVRFGARLVVDDVTVQVDKGEMVGLIGSNGAGKSTLMNAIGGFLPCEGSLTLFGLEANDLPHYRRARMGLGRTFQGAELFADLTVLETVQVAMESRAHAGLVPAGIGLPRGRRLERQKRSEATGIMDVLGLGPYGNLFINELSTGTRRITELACLIASDARLLCLDEPTSGMAQREVEAFGPLLQQLSASLDASVLIIEHDFPLLASICDRMYCMESGRLISEGVPDVVRNDPAVIGSYLRAGSQAIERSGVRTQDPNSRVVAPANEGQPQNTQAKRRAT